MGGLLGDVRGEGVTDLEKGKLSEVRVSRVEDIDPVLSKQRGQVRIWHQVTPHGERTGNLSVDVQESGLLAQKPHVGQASERVHVPESLRRREGRPKDPGM